MRKRLVWFAVLPAVFLGLAGCGSRGSARPRLGQVERVPRLETELPRKAASLLVRRDYTATVEAMERVELCAQVRGVVNGLAPDIDIGRAVRGPSVPAQAAAAAFGFAGTAAAADVLLAAGLVAAARAEGEVLIT